MITLRRAIQQGDPLVERVVKNAARYLGIALTNLANVLNPEILVLGGGVRVALEQEMLPGAMEKQPNLNQIVGGGMEKLAYT